VFYRRRAGDKPTFLSSHGMWLGDRDLTINLKIQACPSGMTLYQERFQLSKVTLSGNPLRGVEPTSFRGYFNYFQKVPIFMEIIQHYVCDIY
jgi:hypothetical protein